MEISTAAAGQFARAWLVSRSVREVAARMANHITVGEAWSYARRLRRLGVALPVRPGSEAGQAALTLTPYPGAADLWLDGKGRVFLRVGPHAPPRSGKVAREGPWTCRTCERHCTGGWARFADKGEDRFVCNRCVSAVV